MAELITVAKYWKQWGNGHWICAVWNNEDLNQVTWEQRAVEGNAKFDTSQSIPSVPYHQFASLIGLRGIYVDRADKVAAAWEEALTSDRPVVIEFKTDPDVPPLPPHISLTQAKHFASAMLKGDSGRGSVLANSARQVLASIFASRRSDDD